VVGTSLGQYQVLELLGAGGMGEVYRARDGKLERDIAIKVLPEDFAADEERLARFEREAKLLASLNHANIATIHGLEDAGGVRFIVMELVEGETLADRLAASGRLELDEALEISRQIARGLEGAHERGVVHRDLKPANVKVLAGPGGRPQAKILDFGLAKAYQPDGTTAEISADISASPTVAAATRTGTILGTPAYMSPEQARGKRIDQRTDIWAFGCMLFEMLTGQRAFEGETVSDTLAAILREEPDWTALPSSTPEAMRRLLRRCLAKDPHRRLRHVGDALLDISEAAVPESAEARPAARWTHAWRLRDGFLASVAVVALAAATVVWLGIPSSSTSTPPTRIELVLDPSLASSAVSRTPFIVSSDGRRLAYVGRSVEGEARLHFRDLSSQDRRALLLAGTESAVSPLAFSPDGEWVVFQQTGARPLMKVELATAVVREICDTVGFVSTATWGSDGRIVFGDRNGVWRVDADGGVPERLVGREDGTPDGVAEQPRVLPDGRTVLVTVPTAGGDGQIELVSLETGTRWRLLSGRDARYVPTPTGHLVYARGDSLLAAPFDAKALELAGPSVVLPYSAGGSSIAVSDTGWLFYLPAGGVGASHFSWVDHAGQAQPLEATRGSQLVESGRRGDPVRISPDGERLAFVRDGDLPGAPDLYVVDRAGRLTRLTRDEYRNLYPVWTADGQAIVYASDRDGPFKLFVRPADGSGQPHLLLESDHSRIPISFSADGRLLAFYEIHPESLRDVWILDMHEGSASPLIATAANERAPAISPDGDWIAYVSDRDGADQIYLKRYPDDGTFHPVSIGGGVGPLWSRDGRELYYRRGDAMMVARIETVPDLKIEPPLELFRGSYVLDDGWGNASADLHPDGDRFLIEGLPGPTVTSRLNVVVGWFEELERLAPRGR